MSQRTAIDFSSASGGMDSASGNYIISVWHPDKPKYGMRLIDVQNGCAYYNTEMVGEKVLRACNSHDSLLEALKMALLSMEEAMERDDPQARTQMEWEAEPMATMREVINRAEQGEQQ